MLDPRVLGIGIVLGVLVGGVGRNPAGYVLGNQAVNSVGVGPGDVAELIVERFDDVG